MFSTQIVLLFLQHSSRFIEVTYSFVLLIVQYGIEFSSLLSAIVIFILSKSIRLKYQWKQTSQVMQEDGYTRNQDLR